MTTTIFIATTLTPVPRPNPPATGEEYEYHDDEEDDEIDPERLPYRDKRRMLKHAH